MPFGDSSILLKLESDYSCGNLFSWILTNTFCFTWKLFKAVANAGSEQPIVFSIFFLFLDRHTLHWHIILKILFSTLNSPWNNKTQISKSSQEYHKEKELGHFHCIVKGRVFSCVSSDKVLKQRVWKGSCLAQLRGNSLIQDLRDTDSSFYLIPSGLEWKSLPWTRQGRKWNRVFLPVDTDDQEIREI